MTLGKKSGGMDKNCQQSAKLKLGEIVSLETLLIKHGDYFASYKCAYNRT